MYYFEILKVINSPECSGNPPDFFGRLQRKAGAFVLKNTKSSAPNNQSIIPRKIFGW
jgi:hypothetical protein